jgi:hypothetical protein
VCRGKRCVAKIVITHFKRIAGSESLRTDSLVFVRFRRSRALKIAVVQKKLCATDTRHQSARDGAKTVCGGKFSCRVVTRDEFANARKVLVSSQQLMRLSFCRACALQSPTMQMMTRRKK